MLRWKRNKSGRGRGKFYVSYVPQPARKAGGRDPNLETVAKEQRGRAARKQSMVCYGQSWCSGLLTERGRTAAEGDEEVSGPGSESSQAYICVYICIWGVSTANATVLTPYERLLTLLLLLLLSSFFLFFEQANGQARDWRGFACPSGWNLHVIIMIHLRSQATLASASYPSYAILCLDIMCRQTLHLRRL